MPSTAQDELVVAATELLRSAGLIRSTDATETAITHQPAGRTLARQSPFVQISMPAHFGVELMLLVGAALRSLHRRHVTFIALCGTIDAALKERILSSSLHDLKRYASQLPNHRIRDLFPLFGLIGVSAGVVEGVLDRVVTDQTTETRRTLSGPRSPRQSSRTSHSDTHPLSPIHEIAIQ